jgi:Helix-turn-helix
LAADFTGTSTCPRLLPSSIRRPHLQFVRGADPSPRKQLDVERTNLTKLETGMKVNPSLAILRRLAKALGVSVPELLS